MTERMDVNRLLVEMRALKAQTQAFGGVNNLSAGDVPNGVNAQANRVNAADKPLFSDLMTNALGKVNEVQQASGATARAYVRGEEGVDITDVMIASQKSGVAFDAAVQVRNKLVEAYKDIMNMPI